MNAKRLSVFTTVMLITWSVSGLIHHEPLAWLAATGVLMLVHISVGLATLWQDGWRMRWPISSR